MMRQSIASILIPLCVCNPAYPVFASSNPNTDDKRKRKRTTWTVDSGATVHCVGDRSLLTSEYSDHAPVNIKVADNRVITAHAVGTALIRMRDSNGKYHEVTLHNVVYHPLLSNLMSVRRLWRDNHIAARFGDHNVLKCKHSGAKFNFEYATSYTTQTAHTVKLDDDVLHSRFGHVSSRRLNKLRERSINFPRAHGSLNHDPSSCDACQSGGARRKPFAKRESNPYTYFGERLSSDLCGPFPKSIGGHRYLLNIVDACTNDLYIYHLRSKSSAEVQAAFQQFLRENKSHLDHGKPIRWHTDNGGEFTSDDLHEFCEEFAVRRSFSVPYAPPQNAHAERMWGILLKTMRTMLTESNVHESFWTYAADHACRLHNVMPSTRLAGEISPYQAKYGMPPDVSKFRVWGCTCYYFLPEHERKSKLSPRAIPAVHLGIDPQRSGYIVYIPSLHRITSAYHLTFQERKFLEFTPEGVVNKPRKIKPLRDIERTYREPRDHEPRDNVTMDNHDDTNDETNNHETVDGQPRCSTTRCTKPRHPDSEPHSFEEVPTRDQGHSHRLRHPDQTAELLMRLDDVCEQLLAVRTEDLLTNITTPNTYDEAMRSRYNERWRESMNKEITDLIKHDTWTMINRKDVPKNRKITKSKWVYKIKLNRDNSIERFKSRFVVCGYSQIKGVDYTHSFSATMRATSFRILLALAAGEKLKLEHFDVTNAFTQSDIDSEIYVEPPKGYPEYKDKVLKLRKSLYGTKQASRMWQLKLRSKLLEMGFTNSSHDPCLFSRRDDDGTIMLIGVYVDDIVLAHNSTGKLKQFTDEFTGPRGFRAKHVGPLSWFLGVEVDQASDHSITINQRQYITKMIERFVPTHKTSVIKHSMPCNPLTFERLTTAKTDDERDRMTKLPYLQLIGSLLYLSTMTYPEIAYHMSILCSFMHDPSPDCYYAAIDLLLYISNTQDTHTFTFTGSVDVPPGVDPKLHTSISTNGGLLAYSDSTWRRPDRFGYNSFGFVVYLFGAPVSFTAKRMKVVALSSAEAEYAAGSYACREVAFVRNVLGDLGFRLSGPTVLAVDNQAAIRIAENMGVTSKTKHFVDAIHYLRDVVDRRQVVLTFVRTNHQHADGFTKALGKTAFRAWQRMLMRV